MTLLRRLALFGVLLAFGVVVLGAYVRLSAAGLGCPDWPGCYGHFTPAAAQAANAGQDGVPIHVGKAWKEMIHRYFAATLGLVIVVIAALAVRARRGSQPGSIAARSVRCLPALPLFLVGLVILQGALGALTVTMQLKPLIVTAHLAFGLATLAMLFWLWLALSNTRTTSWHGGVSWRAGGGPARGAGAGAIARGLATVALPLLALQILLGGWTSSNYAAVACPDFPQCQGAWFPNADYGDAFVLWRGLGINYEGGVLQHPARVAIHFTHRLGAVLATLALLAAIVAAWAARARGAALIALAALALQLFIGVSMVTRGFPLWIATFHNAGAALLLLATIYLVRTVRRS